MRLHCGSAVTLLMLLLAGVPAARAAQQEIYPAAAARTIALDAAGWTPTTSQGGACVIPGVTCPILSSTWQSTGGSGGASDGSLRTSVSTLIGLLSSGTATWTSPTFTPSTTPDGGVWLHLARSADVANLLSLGGSATMTATLIDTGTATRTSLIASAPITSGPWTSIDAAAPTGALVGGHTYRLELQSLFSTPVSVAVGGSVGYDDISIGATTLTPPSGLSTPTVQTDLAGTRLTGPVNPNGLATSVQADLGLTTLYGTTAGPVVVNGTGSTAYSIPLAGLVAGLTYHARVTATSADGTITSSDITFTAPAAPTDAAPAVSGSDASRTRTVTFDRDLGVLTAAIEVTSGASVVATVPAAIGNQATITLPDADGDYGVRVVRTSLGGSTTSTSTTVHLDRVGPSTAGLGFDVTPVAGQGRLRVASFVRPSDALSARAEVLNSGNVVIGTIPGISGDHFDVTLPATDGAYRVRLILTDPAGNDSVLTSGTVGIDTQPPPAAAAPSVSGAVNVRARFVTFIRDPDSDTAAIELLDANGSVIGTVNLPTGTSASLILPDADGTYAVRVRQSDAAGNESSGASTSISLSRVAPPTPTPAPPTLTGTPTPTPAATATPSPTAAPSPATTPAPTPTPIRDALGTSGDAGKTTPPDTGDAGTPGYALATCAADGIALTRIAMTSGGARAIGVTRFAEGTPVEIILEGGAVVSTATVNADGTFTAVLPAWKVSPGTKPARFYAKAGSARSRAIRAARANELERIGVRGRAVILVGTLSKPYRRKSTRFTVLGGRSAAGCRRGHTLTQVGDPRFNLRTGHYRIAVREPAGAGPVIARVRAAGRAAGTTYSAFAVR